MKRLMGLLLAPVVLLAAAACGSDSSDSGSGDRDTNLTVFAAASLTQTFTELGAAFEKDNPGVKVTFNFAGSSDLVTQIVEGAPADVFASANPENMTKLTDQDLIDGEPVDFATNVLQIVVPEGNPENVNSFADLAKKDLSVVICAPEVPCGAATLKIEEASGVDIKPVSEEFAVTDVLNKVRTGEADAGLVYVTDVASADGQVTGISFPESSEAVNVYPIGAVAERPNTELAKKFIELVLSDEGQKVLAGVGFGGPNA